MIGCRIWILGAAALAIASAARAAETTFVVQDCPGYNAWPFVQVLDGRLLVLYNRTSGHEVSKGKVNVYARQSSDGARTWSDEVHVEWGAPSATTAASAPVFYWNRFWKGRERRFDLYRTFDGVRYEKISTPSLDPMPVQVMPPVALPDGSMISLWFSGAYKNLTDGHGWGTLSSSDGGRTWRQRTVEGNLSKADWPTEPALVSLGDGRLLALARAESCAGLKTRQLQSLASADGGRTWTRRKTAIADVHESTPALLYDAGTDELTLYYFHRGPGLLKRRTARAAQAFADPLAWSAPDVVACGRRRRGHDSGNVTAARLDGSDYLAYYAGDPTNASVLVSVVGKGASPADSWEGRRVLFLGNWKAADVSAWARSRRAEAHVRATAGEAAKDWPREAFAAVVLEDGAASGEAARAFPRAKILTAREASFAGTEASAVSGGAVVEAARVICREEGRYLAWPTVCRRKCGELLVVFSGDRDRHVCPWGRVQLIRSSDDGRTWSAPETIQDSILDCRDAGLVELADGTLLLNWFTSIAYYTYNRTCATNAASRAAAAEYVRHYRKLPPDLVRHALGYWSARSADGGKTWSKPVRMPAQLPHGATPLGDGRILAIGRSWSSQGHVMPEDVSGDHRILCGESTDGGRSWHVLADLLPTDGVKTTDLHEPHLVELADGRLVAQVRWHGNPTPGTRGMGIVQSESTDGGRTWTKMSPTPIVGFPPHLLRLADGRLLTVYAKRISGICGEYACLSSDGGRTWDVESEICLCPFANGDLGYPSSVQLADGSILTVYYQPPKVGEPTAILATRWRLPGRF